MANIEDISESMTRTRGVPGKYVSIYDGSVFWYVHIKDGNNIVYDEHQVLNTEEEVAQYIEKALKESEL